MGKRNGERADLIKEKFGKTYDEAMREAMPIAVRAARRHNKWVNCKSDKDDLLAGAYEGILLAWRAWRGAEVSAWSYTAWLYADLYSKREANKKKSVVTTNFSNFSARKMERDGSLLMQDETGAWVEADVKDNSTGPDAQVEALDALRAIGAALFEAIPSLTGPTQHTPDKQATNARREALAKDVIEKRIMVESRTSATVLAKIHGVSNAYVLKVENALRAAAHL